MGDQPTTSNGTANKINDLIQSEINIAVPLVEAACIAEVPLLGVPPIKQLFGLVLKYFVNKISLVLQQSATFAVIDVQIANEERAVVNGLSALRDARKTNDLGAIADAERNYDLAVSRFIHCDGSGTPHN